MIHVSAHARRTCTPFQGFFRHDPVTEDLHLYREGYGDRWAYPLPNDGFENPDDPWRTLDDFMRFCNVVEPPVILRGLFT